MKSRYWSSSAFMWTYDSWGGWYDHVPPPKVDARGYGFRVPALLLSPYAKRGVVDHTVLDYSSMLKFIEDNWRLAPLSTRDASSAGLATAFDFGAPPRAPELLPQVWDTTDSSGDDVHPALVIYSLYGGAAAFAALVVVMAVFVRGPTLTFLPDRATNLLSAAGARPTRTVHGVPGDAVPVGETDPLPSPSGHPRRAARTVPSVMIDSGQTWFEWSQLTRPARPRRAVRALRSILIEGGQRWFEWSQQTRRRAARGRARGRRPR
jgi:hypothetical protein